MVKRCHAEIMTEILDFCFYPQLRTVIVHACNLNWKTLQHYLPELQSKGLLKEAHGEPKRFITTKKGHEFVEKRKEVTSS